MFNVVCFFFLSVYTRKCRNNASISNYGGVSCSKMNLVGALGIFFIGHFLNFPIVFKSAGKNQKKKLRKNGNFYAKQVFDQIDFFIWFYSKTRKFA
ncbi:Uncharacterized protein FWK35_00012705, partial [Aphis craccivora]